MDNKEIAAKLKEIGLRMFGQQIWKQDATTPAFAGVKADVKAGQFGPYLEIHENEKEFVAVKLQRGVPTNKQTYDIYTFTATQDWPVTEADKKRFPNANIKQGQRTAMAL